jgi:hypothetical protein
MSFPGVQGITDEICNQYLSYWTSHGGLPQQGYPISPTVNEVSQQDGKVYEVQYFQRAVFEYHPEYARTSNEILLSLLGAFTYNRKYPGGAPNQHPDQSGPNPMYFPETGKWLGGRFLEYWQAHGSLAQQGMPVSDEFLERSDIDGKTYTVQYFERAVFEYHPENVRPYDVLLSLLGVSRLNSALVQEYEGYSGWICHPPQLHEYSDCVQRLGAPDPSPKMPHEDASGGPPPFASLAQRNDILLANADNALPIRYATHSLKLMNATELGLWQSNPCTDLKSVTLFNGDLKKDIKVAANPGEILVNDGTTPLQVAVAANSTCVDPQGTFYGVRVWPDGSSDVAVKSGDQGALVIEPSGRTTRVLPGQQVHASSAGQAGAASAIDLQFENDFASYSDVSIKGTQPPPDPPRPPDWASNLLVNGDFETGSLPPWTSSVGNGGAFISTRPVRAGRFSAMVTSAGKEGASSGVAGGGNCPGGNHVPVAPGTPYSWSGWVFIPESDARPTAYMRLNWYSSCAALNPIAVSNASTSTTQATGEWLQLTGQALAPDKANFVAVSLELRPTNNTVANAYFDDIQLNIAGQPFPTDTPQPIPTAIPTALPTLPPIDTPTVRPTDTPTPTPLPIPLSERLKQHLRYPIY